MSQNPSLAAALAAAAKGWRIFPVGPGSKVPMIKAWEQQATDRPEQIRSWWRGYAMNIGIATGPSGLVVVDLDDGGGHLPPERHAGARHGLDVLGRLAASAGADIPTNTYTVSTPGGLHLYFRAPESIELRCTSGVLGWKIDTRAGGGYIVGAGSMRRDGQYRVVRDLPVAELPDWLRHALTPPPRPRLILPRRHVRAEHADAYLQSILARETGDVAAAVTGARHATLLRAARTLGRLVGGGELDEEYARQVLFDAASRHIGVDDCTEQEVHRTIADGLAYGERRPRTILRHHSVRAPAGLEQPSPGRPARPRSSPPALP
ncbi:bifunctional DNA primase/polymerase [Jiangella muralis]|uniref:bifunctional DNA primase/polymerase n=1 Tax=Jiangella muralis TaxID=702383 RepID=UPI0009F91D9E|nr:bifunctional DNA primase/polymerase [Jiangella muralis]